MTQIRRNRRTLDESMETVETIRGFDHLMELIRADEPRITADQVHLHRYGYDRRINWDTWLIEVEGRIPWGMANGPIFKSKPA